MLRMLVMHVLHIVCHCVGPRRHCVGSLQMNVQDANTQKKNTAQEGYPILWYESRFSPEEMFHNVSMLEAFHHSHVQPVTTRLANYIQNIFALQFLDYTMPPVFCQISPALWSEDMKTVQATFRIYHLAMTGHAVEARHCRNITSSHRYEKFGLSKLSTKQ